MVFNEVVFDRFCRKYPNNYKNCAYLNSFFNRYLLKLLQKSSQSAMNGVSYPALILIRLFMERWKSSKALLHQISQIPL